jgi:hypothetical protein
MTVQIWTLKQIGKTKKNQQEPLVRGVSEAAQLIASALFLDPLRKQIEYKTEK